MPSQARTPSQAKEALILDAARKRFAAYGYAKTTMDEIAEDVGMAKASLYYYYKAKEDVFLSVIRREQSVFTSAMKDIMVRPASAAEKLRAYAEVRVDLTERLLNINRLSQREHEDVHSIFHEAFQSFDEHEVACLVKILTEGVKKREFRMAHVKPTALLIQHVLQGLRLRLFKSRTMASPSDSDVNREWRCESLLFVDVLLRALVAIPE